MRRLNVFNCRYLSPPLSRREPCVFASVAKRHRKTCHSVGKRSATFANVLVLNAALAKTFNLIPAHNAAYFIGVSIETDRLTTCKPKAYQPIH